MEAFIVEKRMLSTGESFGEEEIKRVTGKKRKQKTFQESS
jgi:hypothetical protein